MKAYVITLLMLLMSIGTFAQVDDPTFDNYFLGWQFLNGKYDVPKDYNKAIKYFAMAANGSGKWQAPAVKEIGYCYFHGLGVSEDKRKAVEFFQKAAQMGDEFAQLYLWYFYAEGEFVKKDKKLSKYWAAQCSKYFTENDMVKYVVELYAGPKVRFMNANPFNPGF